MRRSREQSEMIFRQLGAERVRTNLALDVYLGDEKKYAQAWLVEQKAATEDETLLIARRAERQSFTSNWVGAIALLAAIGSLVVTWFR
jgi:hypothetical protein